MDLGYPTKNGTDYTDRKTSISNMYDPSKNVIKVCEIAGIALGKIPDVQLIDNRPANAFIGEATDNIEGCRQGNVPGSINIPPDEFTNSETQ